ncbi:hypothetical protein [Beihai mantis shrimp virus 2]|uniref:hypothetical protein n=1 Tax=Beihai mantis shrimp virus 2 TaxID=1922429 RepID=UPI00090A636A|nr:hypothetical protein [Beihai mantis shrimp virus 2]APG77581.1 hypothetical protein [Beihai mantis shrimp virus 2]
MSSTNAYVLNLRAKDAKLEIVKDFTMVPGRDPLEHRCKATICVKGKHFEVVQSAQSKKAAYEKAAGELLQLWPYVEEVLNEQLNEEELTVLDINVVKTNKMFSVYRGSTQKNFKKKSDLLTYLENIL